MFRERKVVGEKCASLANVQDVRKSVMYATDGLCDVHLLIDRHTGELLNAAQVCEKTRSLSKVPKWGQDEDEFAMQMTLGEKNSKREMPCLLSSLQVQMLESRATLSCQEFRTWLISSPSFNVKAVHMFHWDGTPRPNVAAIKWAMCHYPSQKGRMQKILKMIVAAAFVAGAAFLLSRDSPSVITSEKELVQFFENKSSKIQSRFLKEYSVKGGYKRFGFKFHSDKECQLETIKQILAFYKATCTLPERVICNEFFKFFYEKLKGTQ